MRPRPMSRLFPITRIDFNVAAGVVRAMKERRISHVVIGWNGQNTARAYIFGSILDQLLKDTRETVIVCKVDHPVNTTSRILLAIPPFAEREAGFPFRPFDRSRSSPSRPERMSSS
jgi:hypothetical protein